MNEPCVGGEAGRRLRATATHLPTFVVIVLAALAGACSKQLPAREYHLEKIGSFHANSTNSRLDENFYVPDGLDGSVLGISVESSKEQLIADSTKLLDTVAGLKFALQLFPAGSSNEFYRAEIQVRSNCVYYPLWQPDLGYLITGVEPFPYSRPELQEMVAGAYRQGRDVLPLINGLPSAGINYRVVVTVETPVPVTNRFQLWLYSHKSTKRSQKNPRTDRNRKRNRLAG